MADLFKTLIDGADAMGNAAIAALDGVVGFTAANASGVVASVGGAVAQGASGLVDAAADLNQGAEAAFGGMANNFASLLQGVELKGFSGMSVAAAAGGMDNGIEDVGQLAAPAMHFAMAKTAGWSMAV